MRTATLAPPSLLSTQALSVYQNRLLNLFWGGFLLYTISFTYGTTGRIPIVWAELCQAIGVMVFVPSSLALVQFKLESNYLKFMFTLYCCWLAVIVARGFSLDYGTIKKNLFEPYGGLFLYMTPLIILLPLKLGHFKKVFTSILILAVSYLIFDLIFIKVLINVGGESSRTILEYFAKTLGITVGFLALTYVYHTKTVNLFALATILFTILLALIGARRGLMLICGVLLLFTFLIYVYVNRKAFSNVIITLIGIFAVGAMVAFVLFERNPSVFNFTKERLDEDTRSVVELYFYEDMSARDWAIGRGMNGLVAAPVSENDDHLQGMPGYRDGIETDYLKIILKGGVVSLGLLLLIALPAVFLGLFYSQNTLSKAAALWILLWMVSLYPTNVTTFTMNYLLVWLSIGICYSTTLRQLPDQEIKEFFQSGQV